MVQPFDSFIVAQLTGEPSCGPATFNCGGGYFIASCEFPESCTIFCDILR